MEINFKDFFLLMIRRIPLLLLGFVVGFAAFYSYTKVTEVPMYACEVTMIVNAAPNTIATTGTIKASQDLAQAYIAIMKDYSFSEKIREKLPVSNDSTVAQIRKSMTLSAVDNSQILSVRVKTSSPQSSYEIARTIEQLAPAVLRQYFDDTGSIVVLHNAGKPTAPLPSNLKLNSVMGGVIGFVLAACITLLVAKLDRRIRSEEDIMATTRYPILGSISHAE